MSKQWADRRRLTEQFVVALFPIALAAAEWALHDPDIARMHPYLKSPLFPMQSVYMEDWATYGVQFALFIPIGVLLWRCCGRGWRWFAGVLGAVLLWEAVQPMLGIDYFRLYNVAAAALGLLLGRLWDAALGWASGRKPALWAMLAVGAGVALAAENLRVYGHTPYEAVAMHYHVHGFALQVLLWYGVLAGKAVCLSSVAAALGGKGWGTWLCAMLLYLTMPGDVWTRAVSDPFYLLPYALCAVGCALFCHGFLFDAPRGAVAQQERVA